jgi:DNA polymerase-3 subunit delta
VGASPETPKELDHPALDAVGAAMPEGDFLRLADVALAGDLRQLARELAQLAEGGTEAIPVIRSMQRRLLTMAPIRARVERGESLGAVMASMPKSMFWKDKELIGPMVETWDAKGIETLFDRASKLERQLMLSGTPAAEGLGEELVAIARATRRR